MAIVNVRFVRVIELIFKPNKYPGKQLSHFYKFKIKYLSTRRVLHDYVG